MIQEWMPDAKTVGLLYCSAEANSQYQVDVVKSELEGLGYTATLYAFADSNDLSAVCTTAANEKRMCCISRPTTPLRTIPGLWTTSAVR